MGGADLPPALSLTRLVVVGPVESGSTLLDEAHARHARVTRVSPGDPVELLDLAGRVGIGRLVEWRGRACLVEVDRVVEERGEPPAPLVLALGVLHTDAFGWAVEKATELGTTAIVPVLCERVQGRRHGERVSRWQRIADAAVAQCGRSRAPLVGRPAPLGEVLAAASGTRFLADPSGGDPTSRADVGRAGMTVLVGPEGGLTGDELDAVREAGFVGLRLGPRILRAETAAVAALALAQRVAGWL